MRRLLLMLAALALASPAWARDPAQPSAADDPWYTGPDLVAAKSNCELLGQRLIEKKYAADMIDNNLMDFGRMNTNYNRQDQRCYVLVEFNYGDRDEHFLFDGLTHDRLADAATTRKAPKDAVLFLAASADINHKPVSVETALAYMNERMATKQ